MLRERMTPEEEVAVVAFREWVDRENVEFLGSEVACYTTGLRCAGTYDYDAEVRDVKIIGDFKSSKAIYREARLQLSFYAAAHGSAQMGVINRLPKKKGDKGEVFTMWTSDLQEHFEAFSKVSDCFDALLTVPK